MVPQLEQLEPRDCPSAALDFTISEVRAPANMTNLYAAMADTAILLFAGQFGLGIPYGGPQQLIVYNVTAVQWAGLIGGPPSTGRWVASVAGGTVPIVFVCDGTGLFPGLAWEEACFANGWSLQDPPGVVSIAGIPPQGPQAGTPFAPPFIAPSFAVADALFAQGNPYFLLAL